MANTNLKDIAYTGNPVNLGNSTAVAQWENSHVSTRFPLADDAVLVADNGKELPCDFLVDLAIYTDGDPSSVVMTSAYIGPALLSVSFSDSLGPMCAATVLKSEYEQYAPVVLEAVNGRDVKGICAFGVRTDSMSEPSLFRFSNGVPVSMCTCFQIDTGRVMEFIDERSGERLSGDIVLSLGAGLAAYMDGVDDVHVSLSWPAAHIRMKPELRESVTSSCGEPENVESDIFKSPPIQSINGVAPDCNGTLAIVFG